jgi:hypothetical protein
MSEVHHTVDPKFTYYDKRARKDVVLYVGLLDAAHRAGLVAIETEILAYPCSENNETCIVRATTVFERDPNRPLRFTAIGDANPRNVGAAIAPHFIRMAETRAKARALRDALNIGMVTAEELGASEDDDGHAASQPRPQPAPARSQAARFPSEGKPAGAMTLEEVQREITPLQQQIRRNDDALSNQEYARYHALDARRKELHATAAPPAAAPPNPPAPSAGIAAVRSSASSTTPQAADYDDDLGWTEFWAWAKKNGYPDRHACAVALGKADDVVNGWTPAQIRTALEVAHQRAG